MASPAELPAILEALKARAENGVKPAAMAMAEAYRREVVRELSFYHAEPGQFGTPSPIGAAPAYRTGKLAGTVRVRPGLSSGWVATASVAPHTIYAKTQEYGEEHFARRFRYMRWVNTGGSWYKRRVVIPERPYLRPSHYVVIASGSVHRAALEAWIAAVGV